MNNVANNQVLREKKKERKTSYMSILSNKSKRSDLKENIPYNLRHHFNTCSPDVGAVWTNYGEAEPYLKKLGEAGSFGSLVPRPTSCSLCL